MWFSFSFSLLCNLSTSTVLVFVLEVIVIENRVDSRHWCIGVSISASDSAELGSMEIFLMVAYANYFHSYFTSVA